MKMRTSLLAVSLLGSAFVIGCGTTRPEPAQSAAPAPAAESQPEAAPDPAAEASAPERIPDACEQPGGNICTPPADFSKRLCAVNHPDIALAMFAKGTPWTRAYVSHEVEAWNASGGHTTSAKLELGEEVLIVIKREAKGAIQIGGASGNYDVLRWDGTCASLMSDEVTLKRPPKPRYAPIRWRDVPPTLRDALLADPQIGKADAERQKECSGTMGTEVPPKCAKADARFTVLVAERVRSGGSLPLPDHMP